MIVATSDAGRGVWSVFICALVLCSAVRGAAQEAELVSGWRFPEGGDAKVKSADGKDGDLFGASAAVCGSYAYVGTPNDRMNGLTMGSVYSYKLTGSAWRLSDKLYPSELGSDGDQFGSSVACHRNTTAVGAPLDGSLFEGGGAVYVYIRTLAGIELSAKLTSYSGEVNENFGHSVAVSHDLVLVGAIGSSEAGDGSGVVYAFRRDRPQTDDFLDDDGAAQDDLVADGWSIEAIIFPADVNSYDSFGYSLAVSGSVIVVGSPNADGRRGAVYVFNRTLVYSEQDDELYTADKTVPSYLLLKRLTAGEGTVSREFFGRSVAVHEHTIAVGQPLAFDDTYDSQPGAAHVFTTHTSGQNLFSWTHVAILKEPVWPRKQNQFGGSVAVMENTVLVGAPGGPYYANPTVYEFGRYHVHAARRSLREAGGGSAYLTGGDEFSYWSDQAVLVPSDRSEMQGKGVSNDAFGSAVAIGELGIAVMGAPNTLGGRGEPSGAVYVYRGSHVGGGGADTDDDPEPVGGEQGEAVEARRVNKSLAWLVVLLLPACALGVCFFMQRRKRRRHRAAGPSTSGGRSYGEGSGAAPDYFDTATEISDLDSEMSFRDIRGRVKNRLSMLSSHAKDWIDNAVQNPIYLSKGDSVYSDDSRGDGMDDSTGSSTGRSSLWRFGGQGGGGAAKYREVSAARPKRSTQQVLATARAVANDMSHPNQEEVAVLLRTHEKDWITEEKFMETLEELVY